MNDETAVNVYVFWRYHDGVTHTALGGLANAKTSDARYRVLTYGQMWVKPALVLPVEAGIVRMAEITAENERALMLIDSIKTETKARIDEMLTRPA
jgi:hypothetical protein